MGLTVVSGACSSKGVSLAIIVLMCPGCFNQFEKQHHLDGLFDNISLGTKESPSCQQKGVVFRGTNGWTTRCIEPGGLERVSGVVAIRGASGDFAAKAKYDEIGQLYEAVIADSAPISSLVTKSSKKRFATTRQYVMEVEVPEDYWHIVPGNARMYLWGLRWFLAFDAGGSGLHLLYPERGGLNDELLQCLRDEYHEFLEQGALQKLYEASKSKDINGLRSNREKFADVCPSELPRSGSVIDWVLISKSLLDRVPVEDSEEEISRPMDRQPLRDVFIDMITQNSQAFAEVRRDGYSRSVTSANGCTLIIRNLRHRRVRIEVVWRGEVELLLN